MDKAGRKGNLLRGTGGGRQNNALICVTNTNTNPTTMAIRTTMYAVGSTVVSMVAKYLSKGIGKRRDQPENRWHWQGK
jgi:hypothetical protein